MLVYQQLIDAMGVLLEGAPAVFVPDAARISGGRADAFVRIDAAEHERRCQVRLEAVTPLWKLDLMLNLPFGEPVAVQSLNSDELWTLERMPKGTVQRGEGTVTRVCRPVAEVAAVVARGVSLPKLLAQVAPFKRVAQRMLVLDAVPGDFDEIGWQAKFHGVGVWALTGSEAVELIAADPFKFRYYTGARWRVSEYAYRAWLDAQRVLSRNADS
ncbi:hypothetical protein [Mycobacteroides abscessus]|uniref:hypothetical protein n=1 Tax=Mycobacteroides abscessus TaxID=36809 RepID=UPI00069678D1|nr:hypothetical protein [Mycobacteroides abscessus]